MTDERMKPVSLEVLSALEAEVERTGTMYLVWTTRDSDVKHNIDIFVSNDTSLEELDLMIAFLTRAKGDLQKQREQS